MRHHRPVHLHLSLSVHIHRIHSLPFEPSPTGDPSIFLTSTHHHLVLHLLLWHNIVSYTNLLNCSVLCCFTFFSVLRESLLIDKLRFTSEAAPSSCRTTKSEPSHRMLHHYIATTHIFGFTSSYCVHLSGFL